MKKSVITSYLRHESKALGNLLVKYNRLKTWNKCLEECLPEEIFLLKHCQIVGLDKQSLIVIADNPHWLTRFRFFIPELLIQLRGYGDFKEIKAICCKVRPAYSPMEKIKRRPLIISDLTAEMMKDTASKIKNDRLKKILMRIAEK
ncbi:MAG TPA: DciA family protein [Gammaproteobacteria bacterium]|nr:DciA family protein [Gammaproteobacteria bacterium]